MHQFDLNALLSDFSSSPRSTTILRANGLRCLLLHLKTGEEIPEHQARGAITVHCLNGDVRFSAGEDIVQLRPGLLIGLDPASPHALVAQEESLLLVTISEPLQT